MAPFVWCGILTSVAVGVIVATRAGRRDGRQRDDEVSSNQSVPLSEFPQVSETTFYLDDGGFPTGAVSTSSTSILPSDSSGSNGSGHEGPEPEGLSLSDEEQTTSQEPHPDIEEGSVSLVNLQVQILGVHAEVDVSRRSSTKRKTREVGKSHCA